LTGLCSEVEDMLIDMPGSPHYRREPLYGATRFSIAYQFRHEAPAACGRRKTMADPMSTILRQWADAGIAWVRFELPDLHGIPRSKRIPLAAVEGFARDGLNMCGATLALDTSSEVVPHTVTA